MKWYEIAVKTTTAGSELIADAFFEIGCMAGVKIIDKNDIIDILNSNLMWDYVDEELLVKSDVATVSGYVSKTDLDNKLSELNEIIASRGYPAGEITVKEIDDEEWYENWKKYYAPISISGYKIVPKWINYQPKEGEIKILIDPGMAFGTGEHESTKMCLELMSDINFTDKDVIDVGTGSGILGIAAALSNARSCYMCDIDSVAVKAAKENAILNKVDDSVEIEIADLLTKKEKKGDVILANLTADILIRLCKDLPQHIKKGGVLICSGIIHARKQEVYDAFINAGFTLDKEITMCEWDAFRFKF